jgi:hypothetical protein
MPSLIRQVQLCHARRRRRREEKGQDDDKPVMQRQLRVAKLILLHVHSLLVNGLVNKFPRKLIPGKQSVSRLLNNSDNRRSVFNVVLAMTSAKQQNCKHVYNIRCFLLSPCQRFIWGSEGRLQEP